MIDVEHTRRGAIHTFTADGGFLEIQETGPEAVIVLRMQVEERRQRQGIGTALCTAAIESGIVDGFVASTQPSDAALAFWSAYGTLRDAPDVDFRKKP